MAARRQRVGRSGEAAGRLPRLADRQGNATSWSGGSRAGERSYRVKSAWRHPDFDPPRRRRRGPSRSGARPCRRHSTRRRARSAGSRRARRGGWRPDCPPAPPGGAPGSRAGAPGARRRRGGAGRGRGRGARDGGRWNRGGRCGGRTKTRPYPAIPSAGRDPEGGAGDTASRRKLRGDGGRTKDHPARQARQGRPLRGADGEVRHGPGETRDRCGGCDADSGERQGAPRQALERSLRGRACGGAGRDASGVASPARDRRCGPADRPRRAATTLVKVR